MSVTFTTDACPITERVDYWHSISCSTYIEYDCRIDDRAGFAARIEATPLADLNLSICNNTPLVADRTARHVARSDTDSMFFGMILEGSKIIEQDGHVIRANAGDCYLVDVGYPYVLTCDEAKTELVLELPRQQLEARTGCSAALRGKVISGNAGAGALATSFIRQLQLNQSDLTGPTSAQHATHAVDLVSLALTNGARETVQRLSSPAAVSRLRLHHAIESSIGDGHPSCDVVADMAGIGMRYANVLLAQEGTSLERRLMQRRLERCKSLLSDQRNRHLQIGDLALSVGFENTSHFCRSFKQAYGVTARDYRSTMLGSSTFE